VQDEREETLEGIFRPTWAGGPCRKPNQITPDPTFTEQEYEME